MLEYLLQRARDGRQNRCQSGAGSTIRHSRHTLQLTFQIVDYTKNIPIGDPMKLTYNFAVLRPPSSR